MKRQTISAFFLVAAASAYLFSTNGHAGVSVNVFPAFGPGPTSPSLLQYGANAISALQGASVPNRNDDPAGYELTGPGPIPISEALVSVGFNSWRGKAAPTPGWDNGTMTNGVFSAQTGNAIYFGLCAVVDDPANDGIRLSDLAGELHWEDLGIGPSSIFSNTLSFAAGSITAYTATRIGVEFGPNNVPGGGDDMVFQFGSSTQKVDAIYLLGLADGIFVDPDPNPMTTDQGDLDAAVLKVLGAPQQVLKASYSLPTMMMPTPVIGNGQVIFIPEPATVGIFGILMAVAALRRFV